VSANVPDSQKVVSINPFKSVRSRGSSNRGKWVFPKGPAKRRYVVKETKPKVQRLKMLNPLSFLCDLSLVAWLL
jgi:hypothetical protein